MSDNLPRPIELKQRQFDYLTEMAKKYDLPDESKAVRCLINYAIEQAERQDEIFGEIRCLHCY
jgi:hypothetical protein